VTIFGLGVKVEYFGVSSIQKLIGINFKCYIKVNLKSGHLKEKLQYQLES